MQCINKSKLIELQQNDEDVQKCKEKYNSGKSNSAFVEIDKILYRIYKPKNNQEPECKQIVMPKVLRGRVLNLAHDSKMSGHFAFKRTYQRLAHHFYGRGMVSDIKRYCNSCDICQRTVEKGKVSKAPLGSMPIIDTPFKRIAIDLIGPIKPASNKGHRYILTIIDYATR